MHALDPIVRFRESYDQALKLELFDPSRAALATSDREGRPSVRFVLVKEWDARGFVFYTNLESRKAKELAARNAAALAFHWSSTGVQVRIEGDVEPVSAAEADRYFASRPRGSQLGAWASPQSAAIEGRDLLEHNLAEVSARFASQAVQRPPFWSGFRLLPARIEFWQDRPDRLHDRLLYTRARDAWQTTILAP